MEKSNRNGKWITGMDGENKPEDGGSAAATAAVTAPVSATAAVPVFEDSRSNAACNLDTNIALTPF